MLNKITNAAKIVLKRVIEFIISFLFSKNKSKEKVELPDTTTEVYEKEEDTDKVIEVKEHIETNSDIIELEKYIEEDPSIKDYMVHSSISIGEMLEVLRPAIEDSIEEITEEEIYNLLKSKGINDYGVSGLMGNLYAESGLDPTNLQNTYNAKLSMTDEEYTHAVDTGVYTNFVNDAAGYGLAQWTYWSRKQNLLNFANENSKSIGDGRMQVEFLYNELFDSFKSVLKVLRNASSVREASDIVLMEFEKPAITNRENYSGTSDEQYNRMLETVKEKRASYGMEYYEKYATK